MNKTAMRQYLQSVLLESPRDPRIFSGGKRKQCDLLLGVDVDEATKRKARQGNVL